MKIAVNTRLLRKDQLDGIGWFTFNTLRHIVQQHPEVQFHFFFDRRPDPSFLFAPNVIPHLLYPPSRHAILHLIWFEWSVRKKLNQIKPDLFLSPDGILCLGWSGKQLAVIHDINFKHYPRALKISNRIYYNFLFPRFTKRAVRIATVSEYSKQDMVKQYALDSGKMDVVYNGINAFYHPLTEAEKQSVRIQYAGGHPYFIFIGSLSPRKNIAGLMKAFNLYKLKHNTSVKLIIVGGGLFKSESLYRYHTTLAAQEDIHFIGRLPDQELNRVLGAASALVYVPLFEGFGIPLIEAMQCGIPIISSNTSSMPEVAGDAAILVNPEDTEAISDAMASIIQDKALCEKLIQEGNKRKHLFSWAKTSDLLWESMMKCLKM